MSWGSNQTDPRYWETIREFDVNAVNCSTETPLYNFAELGVKYSDLRFICKNGDATNKATLYVDRSEDGVVPDEERQRIDIAPGKQRALKFHDIDELFWSAAGCGDPDNGFPTVPLKLRIIGRRRIR